MTRELFAALNGTIDPACYIKSAVKTPEGLNRNTDAAHPYAASGLSQV